MRPLILFVIAALAGGANAQVASYQVIGDGIPQSLTGKTGDSVRGRALLVERGVANCLSCHSIKDKAMQPGGTKGPALDGVGAVLTAAQIRLSVVDMSRIARGTPMPSFHKSGGLTGGGPTLSAEQVEDVVAYLVSLKK
jgi:sulfur-oxidizing protein SoxX